MDFEIKFSGGFRDGQVVRTSSSNTNDAEEAEVFARFYPDLVARGATIIGSMLECDTPEQKQLMAEGKKQQADEAAIKTYCYVVESLEEIDGVKTMTFVWTDLLPLQPPGTKRIIFEFIGGCKDGRQSMGFTNRLNESAAGRHYYITNQGTEGTTFVTASDHAIQMLTEHPPDAVRKAGFSFHKYQVTHREEDDSSIYVRCKFVGLDRNEEEQDTNQ